MSTIEEKKSQTSIQLSGMTCAACALKIEKVLNKLEGVSEANVNFAMEKATVTYDPSKVDIGKMEASIEKLGYSTVKEAVDLELVGMTCAACALKIEKTLNKLPGVSTATVNFAMEVAHVEYNPADVSVTDMQKRVEKLGYQAVPKQEQSDPAERRQKELSKQKENFLFLRFYRFLTLGNGKSLFIYFVGMVTRSLYESMVPIGISNASSILYRKTLLYWCI